MSSFFRSAGDVTSSGEDETSDQTSSGDEEVQDGLLNRITTLSSDSGVRELHRPFEDDQLEPDRAGWLTPGDTAGHQSFLLHALLEERCVNQALEHLNRRSEATRHFVREDVEVQQQATRLYNDLCQHLVPRGLLPQGPEQDRFRGHRHGYRQGLNLLSRGLSHDGRASALSRSSSTFALPPGLQRVFEGSVTPASATPAASAFVGEGLNELARLSLTSQPVPSLLNTVTTHQMLDMSRYGNDFAEISRIGKGGYGEVFAVKHKISGVEYAIKKIPIGNSRLRKIQEQGQAELDTLLNELRVLARLDHPNIVRYYNGWLETTPRSVSDNDDTSLGAHQLLLLDRDHDFEFSSPSNHELHLETRKGSIDIVFEHSDAGVDPVVRFEDSESAADDSAVSSQLRCTETISSVRSRKSTTTKASVEDEEDIIEVPRLAPITAGDTLPRDQSSTDVALSDWTGSAPTHAPSVLTLHLQMSLHPLTLADFISSEKQDDGSKALARPSKNPHSSLRHCFHTVVSILIVLSLLEGVEYLHSEGLVHRDLKPANIFLTPSTRPIHSCVDPCNQCTSSQSLYFNVRIGDFGLVTAMADPEHDHAAAPGKAVGTQHYRPTSVDGYAQGDARLDIYALGVIFVELLWPFHTRMERHDTLDALKKGALPTGFEERVGRGGESIGQCILAMLSGQSKMNCSHVKKWLHSILDQVQ